MSDTKPSKIQPSNNFCAEDAEVTFQSADSVRFRIHKLNLKACTAGFSPLPFLPFEDVVPLTESAATLELLFQFIYPARHPDLESIDFTILGPLAEAAEKYQVYPAMNICKIRMREKIHQHADGIMAYASKHGYHEIMDEVAPMLLDKPLEEMARIIPLNVLTPWLRYYGRWHQVACSALAYVQGIMAIMPEPISPPSNSFDQFGFGAPMAYGQPTTKPSGATHRTQKNKVKQICHSCRPSFDMKVIEIMSKLGGKVDSLRVLNSTFSLGETKVCEDCKQQFISWKEFVEAETKCIPTFTTFL